MKPYLSNEIEKKKKLCYLVKIGVYLVTQSSFTFQAPLEIHDAIE